MKNLIESVAITTLFLVTSLTMLGVMAVIMLYVLVYGIVYLDHRYPQGETNGNQIKSEQIFKTMEPADNSSQQQDSFQFGDLLY